MSAEKEQIESRLALVAQLKNEIAKTIFGQQQVIEQILIAILAKGHALIEGVPGLAKTKMVKTIAKATNLKFNRIQFTPDLMPSDIIGTEILQTKATGEREFVFVKGPIACNILLADEINRTPPKTQAAMLQAMEEKTISYNGQHYPLDEPFFILATQNPIESAGTFPLPEAQLDRFLMKIKIDYPTADEELQILNHTGENVYDTNAILDKKDIIELQNLVNQVFIDDSLVNWINSIVRSTRPKTSDNEQVKKFVEWGAGPRAGQALIVCAKAKALLNQRYSVVAEDIKSLLQPILQHRVLLNYDAEIENISIDDLLKNIVNATEI